MNKPIIVWFQNDLRLRDHPALHAASDHPILPVFIWSEDDHPWEIGAASRWWLHHSLEALKKRIPLVIRKGPVLSTLKRLLHETDAEAVYFHQGHSKLDETILKNFPSEAFNGHLLCPPSHVRTYQVFTPFYKALQKVDIPKPLPQTRPNWVRGVSSLEVKNLKLLPRIHWYDEFPWKPGEEEALKQLRSFLSKNARHYAKNRDFPAVGGTSLLSPHLHFGEISPRQVWHAAEKYPAFQRQIAWREFAHHLLAAFPKTPLRPLRESFENFPWMKNAAVLRKWQKGMTGYPIVDAGMRQLWRHGWMHNRVRMIV
ncbi:MAG: deoxyribodipyrimidine photo-lyase, partial [Verrucomicrobia bacterium]|nr:deoxyribodipyrimidine photo-lyase [Verrucomicrobiota bacterium]